MESLPPIFMAGLLARVGQKTVDTRSYPGANRRAPER